MKQEPAPPLPRFVVRKGAVKDTWMVWDRETQRPAKINHRSLATGLSEEQAREMSEILMRPHYRTKLLG
jgi:hypothetical protein